MPLSDPRLLDLIDRLMAGGPKDRPALIGVAGAQGSGKTTLAREAARRHGGVPLSLDDVYLTQAERAAMAGAVHPLFATRGPPGTHDLDLLNQTLDAVLGAGSASRTPLPVFDKRADERAPRATWPVFEGRPSVVLVEGWCLGATPQTAQALSQPVNALERNRDGDGLWRRTINDRLAGPYGALAARFDAMLFLRAPAFDVVLDWRCQQEAALLGVEAGALPQAERARMAGFIAHFERLTRHMLAGGVRADVSIDLDRARLPGFRSSAWFPH